MIDLLLLLMAVIWGTNYSIIKSAFRELDPQAFNALRMTIASLIFLAIILGYRLALWRSDRQTPADPLSLSTIFYTPVRMTRRDVAELIALGIVGHFLYQYFFIGGLARTTVANSSLMLAATPVVIALLGREGLGIRHWIGAALSLLGIYIVVGRNVDFAGHGTSGDLMMVVAVVCWAIYTLGARRLVARHSPVAVTGLSMAIGTLLYVPMTWPHVRAAEWASISVRTWVAIVYSALFALCVAYTIWYAAVRQIGSARTSVYSNVIPIVAMLTAVVFLGEPLSVTKAVGASAVLIGVALTRTTPQVQPPEPCEP
jgi:drug/metabolite transporter (DMT)-like permease